MKQERHILFLSRWYPHRYDPMFGLFVERHANVASNLGKVTVIYLHELINNVKQSELTDNIESGCRVIRYYYPDVKGPKIFTFPVKTYRFFNAFYKSYKHAVKTSSKPDLVHVNILTRMGVLALFLKKICKIPYVITEHWSRYLPITNTYKGFIRKFVTKIVVRNANCVSVVSKNLENAMLMHNLRNKNYILLPNVVDFDSFVPTTTENNSNNFRFIHISCFEDRSKNISGLLRAISKFSEIRQDFIFTLVGDGIDFESLKEYSKKLNIDDKLIKFTGLLEGKSLIYELQNSDALVLFSNYENVPVVIPEAFACGIPVIATKVGGIPEFVNDLNGILVDSKNEEQLIEAFQNMIFKKDDFDKKLIRQNAEKIFSHKAIEEKLSEIYSQS